MRCCRGEGSKSGEFARELGIGDELDECQRGSLGEEVQGVEVKWGWDKEFTEEG